MESLPTSKALANGPTLKVVTQRTATAALTSRLLDIVTGAFWDDQTFGWRYPTRHDYPSHHRHMFWRYLGAELLNPTVWVVVAYLVEDGLEVPVGYATWQRIGDGADEAVKERDNLLQKSERTLFALHELLNKALFPNPSANKPAIDLMANSFEATEAHVKTLPEYQNDHLHLNLLAVHPSYQRRGIGEALVKWGVNKSLAEDLPCALEASRAGKRVYTKCGFQEIRTCDPFHPTPEHPWQEGMHCRDPDCQFGVGSFMTFIPPSLCLS